MEKEVLNIDEFNGFASDFIKDLDKKEDRAFVVGLYGNLGAGKTAFVKAVSKKLGLNETIISPTFVIMKIYDIENFIWKNLIHIDAYRIEDSKEVEVLGLGDILNNKDNIVFIEWPERIADRIHQDVKVFIKPVKENEDARIIEIKK